MISIEPGRKGKNTERGKRGEPFPFSYLINSTNLVIQSETLVHETERVRYFLYYIEYEIAPIPSVKVNRAWKQN